MIFRTLTPNGDFSFGKGRNNYASKNDAIGLNIRTRLYSWVNDCFFDLKAGIDWTNRLGSKNQRALLEADLRRIILLSYGVTGIVSMDTELNGRDFKAQFSVNTIYSKNYKDSINIGV